MNQYILATLIVLGTAVALSAYEYTVNKDENPKKVFANTVLAGAIVSGVVIYFGTKKTRVSTEPFVMDAPAAPQVAVAQSVPMPMS
jgi:RsiW-degrading membrane proteinase PrsW (M82 family)